MTTKNFRQVKITLFDAIFCFTTKTRVGLTGTNDYWDIKNL